MKKWLRSRLNNQYIYYLIIKNTGCNIARCSALSLISLVSLSGARSFRKLQTNKCGQTKYWISILEQLHFSEKGWSHFCSQLPLGSGSVKSFCAAPSRGHKVEMCAQTHINNFFAQKSHYFATTKQLFCCAHPCNNFAFIDKYFNYTLALIHTNVPLLTPAIVQYR